MKRAQQNRPGVAANDLGVWVVRCGYDAKSSKFPCKFSLTGGIGVRVFAVVSSVLVVPYNSEKALKTASFCSV